jgi:hypothetical protein
MNSIFALKKILNGEIKILNQYQVEFTFGWDRFKNTKQFIESTKKDFKIYKINESKKKSDLKYLVSCTLESFFENYNQIGNLNIEGDLKIIENNNDLESRFNRDFKKFEDYFLIKNGISSDQYFKTVLERACR